MNIADLNKHEFSVYSQNGEDGIIEHLLAEMGHSGPGRFAEIGWHPDQNNTSYLAYERDWVGRTYDLVHHGDYSWGAAVKFGVTRENIAHLLVPFTDSILDLLSIDVDGQDYWLLAGALGAGIRPRLIVIEYNAAFGAERSVTVPEDPNWKWDGSDYFGASLLALTLLADAFQYTLAGTDSKGINAFYVPWSQHRDRTPLPKLVKRLYHPGLYKPHRHSPKMETEVADVSDED